LEKGLTQPPEIFLEQEGTKEGFHALKSLENDKSFGWINQYSIYSFGLSFPRGPHFQKERMRTERGGVGQQALLFSTPQGRTRKKPQPGFLVGQKGKAFLYRRKENYERKKGKNKRIHIIREGGATST